MPITIRGVGKKSAQIPLGMDAAKSYFSDVPGFLKKIDMVETVRELGRPGAYLVIHKAFGVFTFQATSAYAIQVEHTETGMTFAPLDFEVSQLKSAIPVVKGFVEGGLVLKTIGDNAVATELTFVHTADVEQTGPIALVPAGMLKATADNITTMIINNTIESMWKKVQADFPDSKD